MTIGDKLVLVRLDYPFLIFLRRDKIAKYQSTDRLKHGRHID